jgi:hypothetical protein
LVVSQRREEKTLKWYLSIKDTGKIRTKNFTTCLVILVQDVRVRILHVSSVHDVGCTNFTRLYEFYSVFSVHDLH